MTKTRIILAALPATTGELAAELGTTKKRANALCYYLKWRGLVKLSQRSVLREAKSGPAPRLWERI